MKNTLSIALTILTLTVYGQDKYNYVQFNKIIEVAGTEYVIAHIEDKGKMFKTINRYLLFINTENGETKQVDFPDEAIINGIEQVKIDSLGINLILVIARTVDLDGKKGIDWNDPEQIIILSPDGKEKTQLTENKFFLRTWTVNRLTGTIIVTGHYDSNNNKKYDRTDKNEIHIYDLRTLKITTKL